MASCARCHGTTGHGDGLDAKRFYPRPRDLTTGIYKFRSTASGTPPTDEDLFQTLHHGLDGSNMPDWQHLDEATRWQIIAYIKTLSPVFEQTAPAPITLTADPGRAHADLKKGREVYDKLGCAACHGAAGRANGTSAAGLMDDWGMRIRPANLTQGWNYRGGHEPRDIMLRVLTGIDGAGMPSYVDAVAPEDAWHVAYYVASIQESASWNPIARSSPFAGPAPLEVTDPRWLLAERTTVRLRNAVTPDGEWKDPAVITAVTVQAIHTNETLSFKISWDDPTKSDQDGFDGFALLLKPMGSQGDVVTLQAWPYQGAPSLDGCYWSAQTSKSMIERVVTNFSDLVAPNIADAGTLSSKAEYREGRWTLVIQRPFHPNAPSEAAALSVGSLASVAFVVWDGDTPSVRAISPWLDVALQTKEARR